MDDMDGPEDDGKQLSHQVQAFRYLVRHPLLKLHNDRQFCSKTWMLWQIHLIQYPLSVHTTW